MERKREVKDDDYFAKVRIDAAEVQRNLESLNEEIGDKGQNIRYISRGDIIKLIAEYTGDTLALVSEMYRYVEDAIKFYMASVEENEKVVVKAFSGMNFISEYIPGKMSDKFRGKGKAIWVQPQVKSKVVCSRRLNENLSAKFRDGIIGGSSSTREVAFPNLFLDYENLEDEVRRVARKIKEEEDFIARIDNEEVQCNVDKNMRREAYERSDVQEDNDEE